jgi:P4 family phage/plasmid primase-like protien
MGLKRRIIIYIKVTMLSYKCIEYINVENLNKMITSKIVKDETMNCLLKMKKQIKKTNHHTVNFVTSNTTSGSKHVGRLYSKTQSLQSMPRNARKALAYDQYTDIDMVNAHPQICRQVFGRYGLDCPLLTKYCNERDGLLDKLELSRDDAKKEYMKILFGGEEYKPNFKDDYMNKFFDEQINNSKALLEIKEFAKHKKLGELNALGTKKSALASAINFICSDYERDCITTVIRYFENEGLETSTLIHDGFHLRTQNVEQHMLDKAMELIKRQNNFDIVVKAKSLNDFDASLLWHDDVIDNDAEESDYTYAVKFMQYMIDLGHRFVATEQSLYHYNPNNGFYKETDKKTPFRCLRIILANCEILPFNIRGASVTQNHIMTQFVNIVIANNTIENFDELVYTTTNRKINFANGILDFNDKKLIPHTPDIYFIAILPYDYQPTDNLELQNEIFEKLFVGVYGKVKADFLLASLARALAGDVCDKSLNIIIGKGNTGKGVLSDMLGAVRVLCGNINDADLCKKDTKGSSAMNLAWMLRIRHKRIVIMNEASQGITFDHSAIKKFCSGGDTITGCAKYKDEVEFTMQCTGFLMMNDLPKIDGCDEATQRRINVIEPIHRFYEGLEYEMRKDEPGVKLADPSLRNEYVKREDVKMAFISLLCNSYKPYKPIVPDVIAKASMEWTSGDDVELTMKNLIEHTHNPTDKLTCNVIKAQLDELQIKVSNVRIGRYLKEMIGEENVKKSHGKTYYHTVRLRSDADEEKPDHD